MIRSLNTAVLGIKQFQTSLDAIGNNLANINTVGYKSARVDFSDTLAQVLRAPTGTTAGVQLGSGVQVSAIKNSFTQGAIKQTGVRTDLTITGQGFFLVKDSNEETFATRAGDFFEDVDGFLVTNDGYRVQGLSNLAPAYTDALKETVGDIKLDVGDYTPERKDVELDYALNKFTLTGHGFTTGNQIKFSGNVPTVPVGTNSKSTVYFVSKIDDNTYTLHTSGSDAASGANISNFVDPTATPTTEAGWTTDITNDKLTKTGIVLGHLVAFYLKDGTVPGGLTAGQTYYSRKVGDDIYLHNSLADATSGANTVNLTTAGSDFKTYTEPAPTGAAPKFIMVGGASISSYNVGPDGKINMLLTDGTQYTRGQVLLGNFQNPQALLKQGSNLFGNLAAAGQVTGKPGSSGLGRIVAGALEMSNVDMAQEFSNMITTQRAFQANARMITTSDEILREMMALKR